MARTYGGLIGKEVYPSSTGAIGFWSKRDVTAAYNLSAWPLSNPTATLLIVGGGGSGGDSGAGGAGGLLYYGAETPKTPNGAALTLKIGTTYTITVGAGGARGLNDQNGNTGGNSSISGSGFTTLTAYGGGFGAGYTLNSGGSGGCGGGGSGSNSTSISGGTGSQGGNGGNGGGTYGGGGGGGAGANGATAPGGGQNNSTGGNGGNGLAYSITGSSTYYAGGGGGGGQNNNSGPYGTGGLGGGGNGGGVGIATNNGDGTANTGGGGGGSDGVSNSAGAGGSGVVIISLPSGYAATTTGTVTVTTNGTNTVYTFTGSGTFTPRAGTQYYSNYTTNNGTYFKTSTNIAAVGSGNWTAEYWVYMISITGTGGNGVHFDTRYNSYSSNYSIYGSTSGSGYVLKCILFNAVNITNSTTQNYNTWYHVALVKNGSTTTLYVNGTAVGTYADTNTYTANPITLFNSGVPGDGYQFGFNGYISNFRITTTAVYTANFTPPTTPLTAITGTILLTCNSSTISDQGPNSYSINNTGPITVSTTSPF